MQVPMKDANRKQDDGTCVRCRIKSKFLSRANREPCIYCSKKYCQKCWIEIQSGDEYRALTKLLPKPHERICLQCVETTLAHKKAVLVDEALGSFLGGHNIIDEEFQLALAISRSEAEERERTTENQKRKYNELKIKPTGQKMTTSPFKGTPMTIQIKESNQEYSIPHPSHRLQRQVQTVYQSVAYPTSSTIHLLDEKANLTIDILLKKTSEAISSFVNRAKSNYIRNRDATGDTALLSSFIALQTCATDLEQAKSQIEYQRHNLETLQEKLTALRDAREALNALRLEHFQRRKHNEERLEQHRRVQLMQKVADIRQYKNEYISHIQHSYMQKLLQEEQDMQVRVRRQQQLPFHLTVEQQPQMYPQNYSNHSSPQQNLDNNQNLVQKQNDTVRISRQQNNPYSFHNQREPFYNNNISMLDSRPSLSRVNPNDCENSSSSLSHISPELNVMQNIFSPRNSIERLIRNEPRKSNMIKSTVESIVLKESQLNLRQDSWKEKDE